jgi:hypothetical protein
MFGGLASWALWWAIAKSREHAILDKAKEKAVSLDFWKNVFAIVGVIAILFFIYTLVWPSTDYE